jgi:hypothetical protein
MSEAQLIKVANTIKEIQLQSTKKEEPDKADSGPPLTKNTGSPLGRMFFHVQGGRSQETTGTHRLASH